MVRKGHPAVTLVDLPLGSRPRVVNCGLAEHGSRGVETYEVPKLWCLHLYFYTVELVAGGNSFSLLPGAVTLIPPATRLVYKFGGHRYRHFYVHFAARRKGPFARIPLLQHLPQARDEMLDRLQNMQRVLTLNRARAEIILWALLWDLAESGLRHVEQGVHPLMRQVEEFIEARLPGKVTAAAIAEHAGFSMAHINRVVRAARGMTTVQFIRKCRLQRAYRLLIHSTMPIKLVAAECGVHDLQQFNKLMRVEYGKGPRELRAAERLESFTPTWAVDRS